MILKTLKRMRAQKIEALFYTLFFFCVVAALAISSTYTFIETGEYAVIPVTAGLFFLLILVNILTKRREAYDAGYFALNLITGCLMLPLGFYISGGSFSGMPAYIIGVFTAGCMCPDRTYRRICIVMDVVIVAVLVFLELRFPQLLYPISERGRRLDLIFGMFSILLVTGYFFDRLMNDYIRLVGAQVKNLEDKNRMFNNMLEVETEKNFSLRKFRHDVHHFNHVLLEMMECGHFEEAIAYLKTNEEEEQQAKSYTNYCLNLTLNSILNYMNRICEKNGIGFTVSADVSETVPIRSSDFSAIVANLLENAINGAIASGCEQKKVLFKAGTYTDHLIIACENTCPAEIKVKNGMIVGRSIGVESIVAASENYDGTIEYSKKGDHYMRCSLILNMESEDFGETTEE